MALLPFFLRIELLWLPKDLISFSGREGFLELLDGIFAMNRLI